MRIQTLKVFDDIISGTGPWYSGTEFDAMTGLGDKFAIQAITTGIGPTGKTLTVQAEHSPDSEHWLPVSTAEINGGGIEENKSLVGFQVLQCLARFVRFKITMSDGAAKCRLVLFVTVRASALGWNPSLAAAAGNGTLFPTR